MSTPQVPETKTHANGSFLFLNGFLSEISVSGLKHKKKHSVEITVDSQIRILMGTEKTKNPSWVNVGLAFPISDSSSLTLRVYDHRPIPLPRRFVGGITIGANTLRSEPGAVYHSFSPCR
ncbi:hypothetical protein JAAARDRAFT_400623 [Jaapia argillacea MUCL 33604]|uniref:Uncharacterized protein n=1 Tax=Jaapia argillacea MUCL 33604 TaxID=933084 RepID=A0A067PTM4_9AGAM|nr:hypothetical protein JAAARDRAFT_400623 [Jaapia argillacea MUCL 33604]